MNQEKQAGFSSAPQPPSVPQNGQKGTFFPGGTVSDLPGSAADPGADGTQPSGEAPLRRRSAALPFPDAALLTAVGYLTVSAGTARRAYPLPGAQIEIYLSAQSVFPEGNGGSLPDTDPEAGGMRLYRRQISGEDGSADTVPIPTPGITASLSPGNPYRPYTLALVRIRLHGYYPQEAREVPIFPGINALQYFDLVPFAESDAMASVPDGYTSVSKDVGGTL